MYRNHLVHTDIRDYQVTLVPENYETEMGLILLNLPNSQENFEDSTGSMTQYIQFFWLLNVIRTVEEGLTRGDEEEDSNWEPEAAFRRIRETLAIECSEQATEDVSWMIAEFRETIEAFDNQEVMDKESMLALLYSLAKQLGFMDQLSEFLLREIEDFKSART